MINKEKIKQQNININSSYFIQSSTSYNRISPHQNNNTDNYITNFTIDESYYKKSIMTKKVIANVDE